MAPALANRAAAALKPRIEEDDATPVEGLGAPTKLAVLESVLVVPDAIATQCQCETPLAVKAKLGIVNR